MRNWLKIKQIKSKLSASRKKRQTRQRSLKMRSSPRRRPIKKKPNGSRKKKQMKLRDRKMIS